MNAAVAAIRTVFAAWRAATPRHFAYTFLLALVWGCLTIATATEFFARPVRVGPGINALLSMQLNGFAVLLAVLVADHIASPLARRSWPYVVAVVLGVTIGTTVMWVLSQRVFGIATAYGAGNHESLVSFGLRHGKHSLVVWGLLTFVYVSARWAAERRQALTRLQLECVATEKALVESTLVATQARVDPAWLQGTLAHIDTLYESDPAQADALLRDLIAFLRSAIPPSPDAGMALASASPRTA